MPIPLASPMLGDVTQGVVRTTDTGGLPPSMLDVITDDDIPVIEDLPRNDPRRLEWVRAANG